MSAIPATDEPATYATAFGDSFGGSANGSGLEDNEENAAGVAEAGSATEAGAGADLRAARDAAGRVLDAIAGSRRRGPAALAAAARGRSADLEVDAGLVRIAERAPR